MDTLKVTLLAWFGGLLLYGCQTDQTYQSELNEIDSLRSVLAEHRLVLDSLDTEEISSIVTHVDTQYSYLMSKYPNPDDRNFWLKEVAQFGMINKALGRLGSNKDKIRKDLEYADKQLETLASSIADEKLSSEEISTYLNTERAAVGTVSVSFNKYISPSRLALRMWSSFQEPYDSIVNHLRQTQ